MVGFDCNTTVVKKKARIVTNLLKNLSIQRNNSELCDPQNEPVQVLSSQYLGKCAHSISVPVRKFILISTDPKRIYINSIA
jgi:hypothetical protein